ncbi:hypothetical protein I553_0637 [Mycobacterium xenopi 4042]|uniref:Uncharacterized protein n=1 Tax=Mycobacterium xenopi 4042 TaxID=1299334 RepID=X7YJJ7_MYCXE|nr:hypothetical protein I553_0637 [Mycobacterium xenopi 4042]EUA52672.1 hypothetical protein I552_8780 [Mycobacterium xenopi 3993]
MIGSTAPRDRGELTTSAGRVIGIAANQVSSCSTKTRSQRRTGAMSLPALEDIVAHTGTTEPIDGVIRIETSPGRMPRRSSWK